MSRKVLIVEDEPDVSRLLAFNLQSAGFTTSSRARGEDGVAAALLDPPTVVVLDLMLPDVSGHDVCRRLRAAPVTHDVGVLMLTARGDEDDRIAGLESGADDYVVKPFSVREVVLRVVALANRIAERASGALNGRPGGVLRCGEVEIDTVSHDVRVSGSPVSLRPLEYKLATTLMAAPGKVFGRDELLAEVWGIRGEASTRTVDVHVKRLRSALGVGAEVIETVHGFGYRARRDEPAR
jgi:two-component system, OmpR family, phosphate regulon response regulator PhoB